MKAVSQHVESTRRTLMQLLDAEDRRLADPLEIRKTQGVQAYLQALANQSVHLPTYWTAYKPGADVTDWTNSELTPVISFFLQGLSHNLVKNFRYSAVL